MGPRSRLRRWLLGGLVCLVAGECGIRAAEALLVDGEVAVLRTRVAMHEGYWALRPDLRIVQPERDGDTAYASNSLGFRDREPGSRPHARRLLLLGDSITFALSVAEDAGYGRRLEAALSRAGAATEAVNFSIWGYAPAQERAVLERHGLALEPDAILLQLNMNDFQHHPGAFARPRSAGDLLRSLPSRARFVRNMILDRSALHRRSAQLVNGLVYRTVHRWRRAWFEHTISSDYVEGIQARFADHPDDAFFESFAEIAAIGRIAAEHGVPLLAWLSPLEVQLHRDEFDDINERVRRFCEGAGVAYADPLPALRARSDKAALFTDGIHYTEAGHGVIAEWLAPRVETLLGAGDGPSATGAMLPTRPSPEETR